MGGREGERERGIVREEGERERGWEGGGREGERERGKERERVGEYSW